MPSNDMPSKSEKKEETPKGEGSRAPAYGKGESTVKAPPANKKEQPKDAPSGKSAKGSKDDGKDAQTGHAGGKEGAKASKSEEPGDAPSGVNDMEIPHMHLPEMLHQKEGDEVHLHVYGKVKAHNMEKGKNHSVVEVTKVHRDGEENNATPQPKNAAAMPMEQLKQSIKGSSPDTYSER